MFLFLMGSPGLDLTAATADEQAEAGPTRASTATPTEEVLFASGLASSRFHATGAWLSADGTKVAFFVPESPASEARASTLVVGDAKTDARVWRKPIFTMEESRRLLPLALERLARARLIEARTKLPWQKWIPMLKDTLPAPNFASDACFLSHSAPELQTVFLDMTVTYQEPRLRIERGGNLLMDMERSSWRSYNTNCDTFNPTWLQSLYVDESRNTMLVGLGHCGTDACPEPEPDFHVVPLRGSGDRPRPGRKTAVEEQQVRVGFESAEDPPRSLYVQGVPAVSADGAFVLVGWVEEDGERRDPNLQLEVRQVDGNERAWKATLLQAGELSSSAGSLEKVQELDQQVVARVSSTNAKLANGNWRTLKASNPTPTVGAECVVPPRQTLSLPGISLTLERGLLTIRGPKTGSPTSRTKLVPPLPRETVACRSKPNILLETAYVDLERKVLLLRLGYCASLGCPEPATRFHSIRLP
jgi:hypothetical protein